MKVLGIVCSPREGGNTEVMVREALLSAQEAGAEVELIAVFDKTIAPCDGCRTCRDTGECQIKDDMEPIYAKLLEADGVIFGTPVFFWNVSGQAKIIIDRTLLFFRDRKLADKVGAVMAVAGGSGTANAVSTFQNFFVSHGMWPTRAVTGHASEKGAIREDEAVMERARTLGRDLVALVQRTKALAP